MPTSYFIYRWVGKWVGLAESIVGILSLGTYNPPWKFSFIAWETKNRIQKKIQTENK